MRRIISTVLLLLGAAATVLSFLRYGSIGDDSWVIGLLAVSPIIVIAISAIPPVRRRRIAARVIWWIGVIGWMLLLTNLMLVGAELTDVILSTAAVLCISAGVVLLPPPRLGSDRLSDVAVLPGEMVSPGLPQNRGE